jgi:hypothetical protein
MTSSWLRASSDFEAPCATGTPTAASANLVIAYRWKSPGVAGFREGDEIVRHKEIRRNHNCGCDDQMCVGEWTRCCCGAHFPRWFFRYIGRERDVVPAVRPGGRG